MRQSYESKVITSLTTYYMLTKFDELRLLDIMEYQETQQ
jgi:hypothetical protein